MGFRFRKSIGKLFKVNIGKTGISSVSVGVPGARVSVGKTGTTTTVSAPGTGLSYQTRSGQPRRSGSTARSSAGPIDPNAPPIVEAPMEQFQEINIETDHRIPLAIVASVFIPGLGQMLTGYRVIGVCFLVAVLGGYYASFFLGAFLHFLAVLHAPLALIIFPRKP